MIIYSIYFLSTVFFRQIFPVQDRLITVIGKGNWFKTAVLNPGMALYCIVMCAAMIIMM